MTKWSIKCFLHGSPTFLIPWGISGLPWPPSGDEGTRMMLGVNECLILKTLATSTLNSIPLAKLPTARTFSELIPCHRIIRTWLTTFLTSSLSRFHCYSWRLRLSVTMQIPLVRRWWRIDWIQIFFLRMLIDCWFFLLFSTIILYQNGHATSSQWDGEDAKRQYLLRMNDLSHVVFVESLKTSSSYNGTKRYSFARRSDIR